MGRCAIAPAVQWWQRLIQEVLGQPARAGVVGPPMELLQQHLAPAKFRVLLLQAMNPIHRRLQGSGYRPARLASHRRWGRAAIDVIRDTDGSVLEQGLPRVGAAEPFLGDLDERRLGQAAIPGADHRHDGLHALGREVWGTSFHDWDFQDEGGDAAPVGTASRSASTPASRSRAALSERESVPPVLSWITAPSSIAGSHKMVSN